MQVPTDGGSTPQPLFDDRPVASSVAAGTPRLPATPCPAEIAFAGGYRYVGGELELFATAKNWKKYLRAQIGPYLGTRVIEVGAGIGGTTRALFDERTERWIAVEPDAELARCYAAAQRYDMLPARCELVVGTLADLHGSVDCDTILYIDVLEHIEDDHGETNRAAELLNPGGRLIVLAPAHPGLFSDFDRAVGHYRRYTKRSLRVLTPPGMHLVRLAYLDAAGLLASLANKWVLRRNLPSEMQVAVWDRLLVRCSRLLDVATGHRVGKSVLAVWEKRAK